MRRAGNETMPLYAYSCDSCHAEFELLVRSSDTPVCPSCGGEKLQQQIARIATEIKYPGVAKSWRRAAAAGGDLSNSSKAERKV
jgi:putative FmdB family regulatory protein